MRGFKFVVIGAGLALWACSGCVNPNLLGLPTNVTVTQADNGQTVTFPVGSVLTVSLPSDPTTGFQWTLLPTLDPNVLISTGHSFQPPAAMTNSTGGGVMQIWTFSAVGVGQTTIQMVSQPVAPSSAPPTDTFTLTVTVLNPPQPMINVLSAPIPLTFFSNFANGNFNINNIQNSIFSNPQPAPIPLPQSMTSGF